MIGSTEMFHMFISTHAGDVRPGATGKPLPGYNACVLDESGEPLPAGSVGRLAVRGPTEETACVADSRSPSALAVVRSGAFTASHGIEPPGSNWFLSPDFTR